MALKKKFFKNLDEPLIIAEIASAHWGNADNLVFLTKEAKKAGAEAVKFQIFKTNDFVSRHIDFYDEIKQIELNIKEWEKIFIRVKKIKIIKICEIFEYNSLVFGHKSNIFDIYKISSSNIYDQKIYNYLVENKLPFIFNISGIEIKDLVKIINKIKNLDTCIMIGYQNFPTKIEDTNLNKITYLKNIFKDVCIGYADHIDSEDYFFSHSIPLMALGMGAKVIEKHININRALKKNDYYSSLNPDEFRLFVKNILRGFKSLGDRNFLINSAEKKYMQFSKKYMVAKNNLIKGSKLKKDDVTYKRVNKIGLDLNEFNNIKNKVLKKNIKIDNMIYLNDFKK